MSLLRKIKTRIKFSCSACNNVGYYFNSPTRCLVCERRVCAVRALGWVPFYVRVNHTVVPYFVVGFASDPSSLPVEPWGDVETWRVYARPSSFHDRRGRLPSFAEDIMRNTWVLYPRERVDNTHAPAS